MREEREMNPTWMIVLGTIIYSLYAWLTFKPELKVSNYLMPFGLGLALIGNLLWILLAKSTHEPAKLIVYGMVWDTMITLSFLLVPMMFFGVRFTLVSGVGCGFVVLGLLMMKLGTV
jgi:multidrug transporter EmrE-like cation transporter